MTLLALPSLPAAPAPATCSWKAAVRGQRFLFPSNSTAVSSIAEAGRFEVRAFFPNPSQQPILKEALKILQLLLWCFPLVHTRRVKDGVVTFGIWQERFNFRCNGRELSLNNLLSKIIVRINEYIHEMTCFLWLDIKLHSPFPEENSCNQLWSRLHSWEGYLRGFCGLT